jgi:hypothetical protein
MSGLTLTNASAAASARGRDFLRCLSPDKAGFGFTVKSGKAANLARQLARLPVAKRTPDKGGRRR